MRNRLFVFWQARMHRLAPVFAGWLLLALAPAALLAQTAKTARAAEAIGRFRNPPLQLQLEEKFLAIPSPQLAEKHLLALSSAPHVAGSAEDRMTAEYVAGKFREAGLETRIDVYKVWFNYPSEILVEMLTPQGPRPAGPHRERVDGDPYQDDPRVMAPFMSGSPSGDVQGEVVYANYGRPEDYKKLKAMGISTKDKIVLVRYGKIFRGVKAAAAQENGAAGLIVYSDPMDDGYFRGDPYPKGRYRPETAAQRGSIELMYRYPGDPTTPGVASVPSLPEAQRIPPEQAKNLPKVPATPLSSADAAPILKQLEGPASPREWQGALPFTYHLGPGPVKVRLWLRQDYRLRTIWNVIGTAPGAEEPGQWVIAGNHRDAWEFGASDPGSGTAAMLEAVHGIGELLKSGWRPRRTIVFASWDAEEQGMIGSTEFVEQYAAGLSNAVAYFNMDIGVSGTIFGAAGVPSLKNFLVEVTRAVPSPAGGTVFDAWKSSQAAWHAYQPESSDTHNTSFRQMTGKDGANIQFGELGSGSDYTAFLQHLGVPCTDIGSAGPYGVYHSPFDNMAWFKQHVDPTFVYVQQMARIFGMQVLRMAQADVLPYDYAEYAGQIKLYLEAAKRRSSEQKGWGRQPDFAPALHAAARFASAGMAAKAAAEQPRSNAAALNKRLLAAERALLLPEGLPRRPWFRHSIYAPSESSGYDAITLPGVSEAIERGDLPETERQLKLLTQALDRAAEALATFR
jgi:N-acetylated-alpha-linked acidic dipeptidase